MEKFETRGLSSPLQWETKWAGPGAGLVSTQKALDGEEHQQEIGRVLESDLG